MSGYGPQYAADRAEIADLMARYLFAMDYPVAAMDGADEA